MRNLFFFFVMTFMIQTKRVGFQQTAQDAEAKLAREKTEVQQRRIETLESEAGCFVDVRNIKGSCHVHVMSWL